MWYTHYNDAPITDEVNELYQDLLDIIEVDNNISLLDVWKISRTPSAEWTYVNDTANKVMNEYFHEISRDEKWMPVLADEFTKTARKKYDVAVLLWYLAADITQWVDPAWDWEDSSIKWLMIHLQNLDKSEATDALIIYIQDEYIDIEHDADFLYDLIDKTVDFLEAHWISKQEDPDLDDIWHRISNWITSGNSDWWIWNLTLEKE